VPSGPSHKPLSFPCSRITRASHPAPAATVLRRSLGATHARTRHRHTRSPLQLAHASLPPLTIPSFLFLGSIQSHRCRIDLPPPRPLSSAQKSLGEAPQRLPHCLTLPLDHARHWRSLLITGNRRVAAAPYLSVSVTPPCSSFNSSSRVTSPCPIQSCRTRRHHHHSPKTHQPRRFSLWLHCRDPSLVRARLRPFSFQLKPHHTFPA
jgi:hypothetical protein